MTALNIKYDDKEYAKELGAKWKPDIKKWTIANMTSAVFYKKMIELKQEKAEAMQLEKDKKTGFIIAENDIHMSKYAKDRYVPTLVNNINQKNDEYYINNSDRLQCIIPPENLLKIANVFYYNRGNHRSYYVGTNATFKILRNLIFHESKRTIYEACFYNYEIVKFFRKGKDKHLSEVSPLYCTNYNWFIDIERDLRYYKYKASKELNKFFINDLAKIINGYIIKL